MKKKYTLIITLGSLFIAHSLYSQEKVKVSDTPINDQFEEIIKTSRDWHEYEVIKKTRFLNLQQNTRAKIIELQKQLEDSKQKITTQENNINFLKKSLETSNKTLAEVKSSREQVNFLGISIPQKTYQIIIWGIILCLLVASVFLYFRYNDNRTQTLEAKKHLAELEAEFDEYRKSSLEKQQELGRKLQDERNKHKEDSE